MARPIKDDIVLKQIMTLEETDDLELFPMYGGEVNITLEKTKLEPSEFGIVPKKITTRLQTYYNQIQIPNDTDCEICLPQGQAVTVEPELMRIMKAVCLEQVHTSEAYSKIIAAYVPYLLKLAIAGTYVPFPHEEDATKLELVVCESMNEFLNTYLPEKYRKKEETLVAIETMGEGGKKRGGNRKTTNNT